MRRELPVGVPPW